MTGTVKQVTVGPKPKYKAVLYDGSLPCALGMPEWVEGWVTVGSHKQGSTHRLMRHGKEVKPGYWIVQTGAKKAKVMSSIAFRRAYVESESVYDQTVAWAIECFWEDEVRDVDTRALRFIEEAIELVQAVGLPLRYVLSMVEEKYAQRPGDLPQEFGGTVHTLAVLGHSTGCIPEDCARDELARVQSKIEQIRARDAAKPKVRPL